MASVIGTAILRTQTDERLVALARVGHKRAYEVIAERYRGELSRAVRRILPRGSVEDALQQTNLQAWQALSAGTEVRELRAWLHRIARNAAIAAASRGYDYDELKDALLVSPGPEEDFERRDAVRRALRGIAALPERQRDALLTVAVEGRSHAELGLDLGITDTAARQLVRRARVSLIGLMSIAMPPQLVQWAARTGHSVVAAKLAAGKAAAGKAAAGTGLGGGLGGSALKVGAIAVTVGGVAAGVPPIRQALVPSRPPVAAHHHAPRVGQPSLAVAVSTPRAYAASPGNPSGSGAGTRTGGTASTYRRHAVRTPQPLLGASAGETHAVVTGASSPAAPASTPAAPASGRIVPTNQSTSSPVAQSAAALLAWWLTHRASAASETTSPAGRGLGQEHESGATSPTIDHSQASACGTTGATGPTGPTSSPPPSSTSSSQSFGGAGSGWVGGREGITATPSSDRNAVTGGSATGLAGGGAGEPNRRAVSGCDVTATGSSGRSGG